MSNPIGYELKLLGDKIELRIAGLEATVKTLEKDIDTLEAWKKEAMVKLAKLA